MIGIQLRRFACLAMLTGIVALGTASPAHATFQLMLSASSDLGASGVTITDNGAGDSLPGMSGVILFSGTVGQFAITITTGESKPLLGSPSDPNMDLNSIDTKLIGSLGDTLTIKLTDTDFNTGANEAISRIGGTLDGNESLTSQLFLDSANTPFAMGGVSTTPLTFPTGTLAFSGSNSVAYNFGVASFSMTLVDTITAGPGAGVVSFDHHVVTNPEPATLAMIVTGLPALGLSWARRRKARARIAGTKAN